jgi:uncharacterized membrane protein (Fun14 family)
MRAIRASEVGVFLFCRRAWWYQKRGVVSQNQMELSRGDRLHRLHSRRVAAAGLLRGLAYALLLAALAFLVVFLLGLLI